MGNTKAYSKISGGPFPYPYIVITAVAKPNC